MYERLDVVAWQLFSRARYNRAWSAEDRPAQGCSRRGRWMGAVSSAKSVEAFWGLACAERQIRPSKSGVDRRLATLMGSDLGHPSGADRAEDRRNGFRTLRHQ